MRACAQVQALLRTHFPKFGCDMPCAPPAWEDPTRNARNKEVPHAACHTPRSTLQALSWCSTSATRNPYPYSPLQTLALTRRRTPRSFPSSQSASQSDTPSNSAPKAHIAAPSPSPDAHTLTRPRACPHTASSNRPTSIDLRRRRGEWRAAHPSGIRRLGARAHAKRRGSLLVRHPQLPAVHAR